jgi:hypothetical protein
MRDDDGRFAFRYAGAPKRPLIEFSSFAMSRATIITVLEKELDP